TGCDHVEIDGLGDPVRMGQRARLAIVRLIDRVDRQRDAMSEERLTAVAVERHKPVPKFDRFLGQGSEPSPMPGVESDSERAVREARCLSAETGALQIELQTGVLRIAVEHL